jgi:hypothetical protein
MAGCCARQRGPRLKPRATVARARAPSRRRSLERAGEDLRAREEAVGDLRESLARLRDDYSELQAQHAAAQREAPGKEAQREMGVRARRAAGAGAGAGVRRDRGAPRLLPAGWGSSKSVLRQTSAAWLTIEWMLAAAAQGPRGFHAPPRTPCAPHPCPARTPSSSRSGKSTA